MRAATAAARTTDPSTAVAGCLAPVSGTVYRIDVPEAPAPGATKQCVSATHARCTWSAQGPAGAKGDPGAAGAVFVGVANRCAGKVPIGGGRFATGGGGEPVPVAIVSSAPATLGGNGWVVKTDVTDSCMSAP